MSTTPIFDQLCQELGDVIELDVSTPAINFEADAVAGSEPKSAADSEQKKTVTEWSVPEACWVTVPRFDKLSADHHEQAAAARERSLYAELDIRAAQASPDSLDVELDDSRADRGHSYGQANRDSGGHHGGVSDDHL